MSARAGRRIELGRYRISAGSARSSPSASMGASRSSTSPSTTPARSTSSSARSTAGLSSPSCAPPTSSTARRWTGRRSSPSATCSTSLPGGSRDARPPPRRRGRVVLRAPAAPSARRPRGRQHVRGQRRGCLRQRLDGPPAPPARPGAQRLRLALHHRHPRGDPARPRRPPRAPLRRGGGPGSATGPAASNPRRRSRLAKRSARSPSCRPASDTFSASSPAGARTARSPPSPVTARARWSVSSCARRRARETCEPRSASHRIASRSRRAVPTWPGTPRRSCCAFSRYRRPA
jgi:hypothetical protein